MSKPGCSSAISLYGNNSPDRTHVELSARQRNCTSSEEIARQSPGQHIGPMYTADAKTLGKPDSDTSERVPVVG